jgi:two-component system sensor histidine kinase KdpD
MEYLRAVVAIAVTTAVAAGARAALGIPDVEMLYLLGVMVTALTAGRRASLLGAALAVVSYDFFFVPPPYTLDVADARYLLTFAMMFGVSIVIGTLTLRLREQRQAAVARERRA